MDGTRGALASAFATALALGEIDIGQIVLHSNGFERTSFRTLAATDTGSTAIFAGSSTFFFIDTGHEHSSGGFLEIRTYSMRQTAPARSDRMKTPSTA